MHIHRGHAEGLSGYGLQGIEKSGMSGRVRTSCRYGDIMLRPLALRHVALPTRSLAHQGSGDVNLVTILRIRLG